MLASPLDLYRSNILSDQMLLSRKGKQPFDYGVKYSIDHEKLAVMFVTNA